MKCNYLILQENKNEVTIKNANEYSSTYDVLTTLQAGKTLKQHLSSKQHFFCASILFYSVSPQKYQILLCSVKENETLQHCVFKHWLFRKYSNRSDFKTGIYV